MAERPSYILFITDQQRYDHLGCNGHPVLKTPHIDAIASEGVSYDRFYVASPVCMPNRASLMTSRLPSSHGVRSLGIPLDHRNVTFVELMAAAGYDTALIGKSHLQNVSKFPTQYEKPTYRDGFSEPPEDLAVAIRSDLDGESYQYERQDYFDEFGADVPTPFYGFEHYDSVARHGTKAGGNYHEWLEKEAPEVLELRGPENQFPHDYTCPQAFRTKVPEEFYSTSYIAKQAMEYLEARKGNPKPFFLMVSFPDPHHPFNPPGKYWDMYKPEEMIVPDGYDDDDWEVPEHVLSAERARAGDASLGKKTGYTFAVTKQQALEARALTCGMMAMVDDAVGDIRAAADKAGLSDSTVQIYTSDHGDHLGDHRLLFKGSEQYDNLTHVPFIWADPKGNKGARADDLAQTHDIGATILEHAKIEPAAGMQGHVMRVAGGKVRQTAFIQYDTQRPQEAFGIEPRAHTIVHDRYRLTMYRGKCQNELFDLENDPSEMKNLWDSQDHQAVKAKLVEVLAEQEIAAVDRVPFPTAEA